MNLRNQIKTVETFQECIYGSIEKLGDNFPLSLQDNEAGASSVLSPDGAHSIRRYLWTDAFGILNYVSLGMAHLELGEHENYHRNIESAGALIDSVFAVLGTPSSANYPMAVSLSPMGGYKGLRIGKLECREGNSDAGMIYDGMYFHYLDKFLFALCRYAHCLDPTAKASVIAKAVYLVKDIHPHFLVPGAGYMWKVNTDMSPIPAVQARTNTPSHDTVSAFVVYKILEAEGGDVASELAELFPLVVNYFESPLSALLLGSYDALGLGCNLWTLQFLEPSTDVTTVTSGPQEPMSTTSNHDGASTLPYNLVVNNLTRYTEEVKRIAKPILQAEIEQLKIPQANPLYFRVYGGLLGAQLIATIESPSTCPDLYTLALQSTEQFVNKQSNEIDLRGRKGSLHSINLTMLSACVLPLAWKRMPHEQFFKVFRALL